MRTYQHPIYQDNTMAIRAEYDEEKRVFDLMKKFLYIVGTITAIVVFLLLLVNSPALITQTGAIGIIALVPVLLAATAFTGFYVGTVPAGYIAAWRAIKRSKLFVWGNALGLLLIATLQPERPGNRRDARGKPEPQSQGACKKERWEVSFREEA